MRTMNTRAPPKPPGCRCRRPRESSPGWASRSPRIAWATEPRWYSWTSTRTRPTSGEREELKGVRVGPCAARNRADMHEAGQRERLSLATWTELVTSVDDPDPGEG